MSVAAHDWTLILVRFTALSTGVLVELGPGGDTMTCIIPYEDLKPEWRRKCDDVRDDEDSTPSDP